MLEEPPDAAARRPVFLVIALLALWFVGMNLLREGFATVEFVNDPFARMPVSLDEGLEAVRWKAYVAATRHHAEELLPVGVAQALLGGALVVLSVRALFVRRLSAGFSLQVIVVSALVSIAAYVLREPVRAEIIEAVVKSGLEKQPAGLGAAEFAELVRSKWRWSFRIALGFQLVALSLGLVALTRPAVRLAFGASEPSVGER